MSESDRSWLQDDPTPCRVLVVDDDPLQRMLIGEILEAPRYAPCFAASGRAALVLLREQAFDVVLLDRNMPDLGGEQVCRHLRHELGLTQLPVLMVTGSGSTADHAAALQAGADDIVHKPYLPQALQARVDAAAQRGRAATLATHHHDGAASPGLPRRSR